MISGLARSLAETIAFVLAPRLCLGCRAGLPHREREPEPPRDARAALRAVLCAHCRSELAFVGDGACGACGRARLPFAPPHGSRCGRCAREPRGFVRRTVALYRYTRAGRNLIRSFKFHGRRDVAGPLGRALALRVEEELPDLVGADGVAFVTSVPAHWTRRFWRGYDHAELLGRAVARELGLPYERALRRVRRTRALFSVPRKDREAALEGALAAVSEVAGRWVLLVDDIRTSGSTLATCGRALRAAGAARVDAAVVGR